MITAGQVRPGITLRAWVPGTRRTPGRWVERRVTGLQVLLGHMRATYEERDPARPDRIHRSAMKLTEIAAWATEITDTPQVEFSHRFAG